MKVTRLLVRNQQHWARTAKDCGRHRAEVLPSSLVNSASHPIPDPTASARSVKTCARCGVRPRDLDER
jgi:hypothetical protein